MVNFDDFAHVVKSLLEELAKDEEGLELSDEAVAMLNKLAELMGLEHAFKRRKKEEYGYPYPGPQRKKSEEAEGTEGSDKVLKALEDILTELKAQRELLEARMVTKSAHPTSRQPAGEPAQVQVSRRWGEGLFADVIFGS